MLNPRKRQITMTSKISVIHYKINTMKLSHKLLVLIILSLFVVNESKGQSYKFTSVKSASYENSFWGTWEYSSYDIAVANNYSGARITIDKGYSEGKEVIIAVFDKKGINGKRNFSYTIQSHKFTDRDGKERKIADGEIQEIREVRTSPSLEKIAKGKAGTINIFYSYGTGVAYSVKKGY